MNIKGETKVVCVIGNPIEHSISPQLHNSLSKYLSVDMAYVPFKVEEDNLEEAVKGLRALNVVGFNVTIPHKETIIRYLDHVSEEALLIGAVNTVKNVDGHLYGYNTDADGFLTSFKEEAGTDFAGKNVVLIGAGGAARAIAVKAAMEGASSISILNRTISNADEIVSLINTKTSAKAKACSSEANGTEEILTQSDIIINTTPIGMYPNTDEMPLWWFDQYHDRQIVYDVIYNPPKTKFLANAYKKGCTAINGLGMLIYQGIYAYEIWTGIKISQEIATRIFKAFPNYLIK